MRWGAAPVIAASSPLERCCPATPLGAIVEKDRWADVDVRLADGSEPTTCSVSTHGGRYELRCGSYSWDEATPVHLAHPRADQD